MYADVIMFFFRHFSLFVGLMLGLVLGSFMNVVFSRLPIILARQKIAPADRNPAIFNLSYPPSHCPSCRHQIAWYENIPVLSYLFLRGRCSGCGLGISLKYPAIELLFGAVGALVFNYFGLFKLV
jgi:leader peptidase (prepilin peptidase) / N-methyltransferase